METVLDGINDQGKDENESEENNTIKNVNIENKATGN